jgi:hypothetical protein
MMGIGFAGLAFAGYRARKRTAAVAQRAILPTLRICCANRGLNAARDP